jgi:hypothetical protein
MNTETNRCAYLVSFFLSTYFSSFLTKNFDFELVFFLTLQRESSVTIVRRDSQPVSKTLSHEKVAFFSIDDPCPFNFLSSNSIYC